MNPSKVIVLLILFPLSLVAQELPKQNGFTWWKISELKAAILVPKGWHTKTTTKNSTLGFFVTQHEIAGANPSYDTGLSLNVIRNFQESKGKDPLDWAKQYRTIAASKGQVIKSWDKNMGSFNSIGLRVKVSKDGHSLIMHHLFIINPETGTLYFYLFEAPSDNWDEAWGKGEKIMKLLMIDDEI